MNYKIEYSKNSLDDLKSIYEYIAFELYAPITASNQVKRITKAISPLKEMPFMYKVYEEEPWKSKGIHIFSIDSYVILYLPNKKAKRVIIVRILYGARDIQTELTNTNS